MEKSENKGKYCVGKKKFLLCISLFMIFVSTVTIILQALWTPDTLFSGMYIPDALSYEEPIFKSIHSSASPLASFFLYPSPGTLLLYYPFWELNSKLYFILNITLLLAIVYLIYSLKITNKSYLLCVLSIACNPYLYLAVSGPNKEIPLTFLTILFYKYWFEKRKIYLSITLAIFVYFFRDGYGILLLAWMIFDRFFPVFFKGKKGKTIKYNILLLSPLIICILYSTLSQSVPAISRNINAGQGHLSIIENRTSELGEKNLKFSLEALQNPVLAVPALFFRIVANTMSLLVRPALTTVKGKIYILGFAFWIYGFFLSIVFMSAALELIRSFKQPILDEKKWYFLKLSYFVLFILFGISLAPFIQPRYLMPVFPIATVILSNSKKENISLIMVIVSVFFLFVFLILNFFNIPIIVNNDTETIPSFF